MIKFFRKIRKNLLSENKFNKYLLYAFGEIVLVMIGILLALSVNNWNTQRQENEANTRLLKKLDNELQLNINRLVYLKDSTHGYKVRITRNDSLMSMLSNGISENNIDKIVRNFYLANTLNLHTSTYEEMKNTGRLYKLNSKNLSSEIEIYYRLCDRESFYVLEINKEIISQIKRNIDEGWYKVQQDFYTFGREFTLKNNQWLYRKNTAEFQSFNRMINLSNHYLNNIINRIDRLIDASKKLQEIIREELINEK